MGSPGRPSWVMEVWGGWGGLEGGVGAGGSLGGCREGFGGAQGGAYGGRPAWAMKVWGVWGGLEGLWGDSGRGLWALGAITGEGNWGELVLLGVFWGGCTVAPP